MTDFVELARRGDLGELAKLSDPLAYRWLQVARDFGHVAADGLIDDLLEGPLRDHEDVVGGEHFALGVDYLRGAGLPVDLERAEMHLEAARDLGISGDTGARSGLSPAAADVFGRVFSAGD
ncbi:hypothetical protein Lfu02_51200 [Longispora fulva]|uniref:Sel1 repeat family protein n=1 Tax=Longispora fulva TaxID=619741 RepID=A0A8J7KK66_9ACTN|nr:hypothetical protein [Longispora fulva]MBG6140985.1 hypothetical protein [Longispora fulva]GIG60748.1 hypothetical protein Lfu02_51200 [Longispora fulva]